MPIYTYRCKNCGIQFEATQKFTDSPLTQCPECGKKTLQKVYTPVGIVFKGSGFYATDNRSPSGQSWASGSKSDDKPAESKGETKHETTAESKTEAKGESKNEPKKAEATSKESGTSKTASAEKA